MSQVEQRENPTAFFANMIEKGKPHLIENSYKFLHFVGGQPCGCPVGMALVGYVGNVKKAKELRDSYPFTFKKAVADTLDIPYRLVVEISDAHSFRDILAITIIKKLRAGDFEAFA